MSETPQVEVASEFSDPSDTEQLPEPARIGSIDSAAYFELSSPSPTPSDIFGYTPKFVIPTEYQLPEEIPNTYPTPNQSTNPRQHVSPATGRQVPNSDGVITSESIKETGKPESATLSAKRNQEVDEIAETPGPLRIPESQWSQINVESKSSCSQCSIRTFSYRSIISTLVSQFHHSGN